MVLIYPSKIDSQLIVRKDKKTCESRALSSLSHQGTPSPDTLNGASIITSIPERQKLGPSDYELQREANIAENKRLLASLGLSKGGSGFIDKSESSSKVKRKKGEKGKRYAFCLLVAYPNMI